MTHSSGAPDDSGQRLDRRSAIKKGVVGAAAAGLVWSAPKVEGLSLRPNYAAAQTGGVVSNTGAVTVQFNSDGGTGLTRQDNMVCPDFSLAVAADPGNGNQFAISGDWAFSPGGGTVNQITIDAAGTGTTAFPDFTAGSDSDLINAGSLSYDGNLGSGNPKTLTVTIECT